MAISFIFCEWDEGSTGEESCVERSTMAVHTKHSGNWYLCDEHYNLVKINVPDTQAHVLDVDQGVD